MASDSSREEMRQRFAQWLREAGLERYTGVFAENDIDFGNAGTLSEADLKELGFTLGHRKNFLAAVQALPGAATPAVVAHEPVTKLPAVETGERRQLTVLFCDLVGFTELASRVDPEVLQGIIRTYEDACAACITRYEGYVFQRLGDGIAAFFGFPLAHEGEAERAIQASLEAGSVVVFEQARMRIRPLPIGGLG